MQLPRAASGHRRVSAQEGSPPDIDELNDLAAGRHRWRRRHRRSVSLSACIINAISIRRSSSTSTATAIRRRRFCNCAMREVFSRSMTSSIRLPQAMSGRSSAIAVDRHRPDRVALRDFSMARSRDDWAFRSARSERRLERLSRAAAMSGSAALSRRTTASWSTIIRRSRFISWANSAACLGDNIIAGRILSLLGFLRDRHRHFR